MKLEKISASVFEAHQYQYSSANFIQSREMSDLHQSRDVFEEIFYIGWLENDQIIGQSIVGVRRRFKFFKEAILLQGPLLLEEYLPQLPEILGLLEEMLREEGISRVEMNPYFIQRVSNENLEVLEDHRYAQLMEDFQQAGYAHEYDLECSRSLGMMFRKDVSIYEDTKDMYQHLSNSVKRDIRKYEESHIVVRELEFDEIDIFYSILEKTAERKGFPSQPLQYFQIVKESFGDKAKFMVAFLDVEAYQNYYQERIQFFEKRIEDLQANGVSGKPLSKKTRGLINDAKDQLASYQKRKVTFEALDIQSGLRYLPLSGYLFLCYGEEVLSFVGGSYEEYLRFGGSTLLNWYMMTYAKENGFKYFNFYGTIEVSEADTNDGNFNYKRQFGGELDLMVGLFNKIISPTLNLLAKIKKI